MIYIAFICLGLSALFVIANIAGVVNAGRKRRRGIDEGYSSVPFLSLFFATLAWMFGRDTIGFIAFIPTALDPGTWTLVALPRVLFGSDGILPNRPRTVVDESGGSAPSSDAASIRDSHQDKMLARARRLLIDELERSATCHEVGQYDHIGATFDEIDALVRRVVPKQARENSPEYMAYILLDSWIDSSNHGWLHYEPVTEADWPRLARHMIEVLEGRREFHSEDFL